MFKNLDRNIFVLISWLAVLIPLCFIFPLLLFAVFFVTLNFWENHKKISVDKKNNKELKSRTEIQKLSWLNATPEDDWYNLFMAECESPAEERFLAAMIRELNLKPNAGKLVCSLLTLEMQVRCPPYRFDFLINGRQVVEIDGAAWHSSPEQVERDRIRDKISVERGYKVLRIPARVVFKTPNEAVRRVKATLAETPVYTKVDFSEVKKAEDSPSKLLSPLGFLNEISVMLSKVNENASRMYKEEEEKQKSAKFEESRKRSSMINKAIVSSTSQSLEMRNEQLQLLSEECLASFDISESSEKTPPKLNKKVF